MERPTSAEWGIGGEFEELAALQDALLFPCDGQAWDDACNERAVTIGRYIAWLMQNRRPGDAEAMSLIVDGRLWPAVRGNVIWLERAKGAADSYTPSHHVPADVYDRLAIGRANKVDPHTRWYDYVMDAILDLARASSNAALAKQQQQTASSAESCADRAS